MLSIATALHQRGFRGATRHLRECLGFPVGALRLRAEPWPLSAIGYNAALTTAPQPYFASSEFRPSARDELCARIEAATPDVVGLCEVFQTADKEAIIDRLRPLFPSSATGPDEADLESDGGLVLLSRHPVPAYTASIYRATAGLEGVANKGVIHFRVAPAHRTPIDVFFTHMQDRDSVWDGRPALLQQCRHLGALIAAVRDPELPALLFGDINVAAHEPDLYQEAFAALGDPIDLWTAQQPIPSPDNTSVGSVSRLDYMLLYPGGSHGPVLDQIEILRWTRDGADISDHYGLATRFAAELVIDSSGGPVIGVAVRIESVRCLDTTSGGGDDTVSFQATITTDAGSAVSSTGTFDAFIQGAYKTDDASLGVVAGSPGAGLTLTVTGTEHDVVSADDSLGQAAAFIPAWRLAQHRGHGLLRSLLLTGDGGQYAVTVRISVQ